MAKKLIGVRKKADSMKIDRPPTKEEKAVIHWVRTNVPTKVTKFLHSHVVEYFTGSKAVDALLNDSPWAASKTDDDASAKTGDSKAPSSIKPIIFETREDVVYFMDDMLKHKFFHRADKITVSSKPKSSSSSDSGENKQKDKSDNTGSTPMLTRRRKADAEREKAEDEINQTSAKSKRKIRLDMHLEQEFLDSTDAYVWIYNPMPWYYWIFGALIVAALIIVCLFPLWPTKVRIGVHYLSIAGAVFVAFILGLAALKYFVFALLYCLSGGRLKFRLLPNLTEDVSFLESFWPIYDYTFTNDGSGKATTSSSKRHKSSGKSKRSGYKDGAADKTEADSVEDDQQPKEAELLASDENNNEAAEDDLLTKHLTDDANEIRRRGHTFEVDDDFDMLSNDD